MKTIGKKLKAIYLMAVIALVSICMSFIPLMTNTVKADVEGSTAGLRITGAQVKTIDGATQQDGTSQFAVYFHAEITEEFYGTLTGESIQFGMLVGPKAMITAIADYDGAVTDFDAEKGAVVTNQTVEAGKSANFRFVGTDLSETVEFENGVMSFEAGVVFDEADLISSGIEDVLKKAASTKLTAIPYYVVDGNAKLNALDATTRTAKDVLVETAFKVENEISTSDFDANSIDFFLDKYVGEVEFVEGEYYFDKHTDSMLVANANNELVAFDSSAYVFGGVASADFDGSSLKDGSIFGVSYVEDGVTKIATAKVATKVLSTLKDFFNDADGNGTVEDAEMTRANYIFNLMPLSASGACNPTIAIKGLYVLANNIDLKSNGNLCNRSMLADGTNGSGDHTVQIFDGSKDVGFRGTLDGRGFALMNLNPYGSSAGMFGAFYGATVKNIAFYGGTNSAGNGSGLVIGCVYNSTFENVYVRLIGNTSSDQYSSYAAFSAMNVIDSHGGSSLNNIVVEAFDGLKEGNTNDHQRIHWTNSTGGTYTNTAIVGMPAIFSRVASTTDSSKYTLVLNISTAAIEGLGVEADVEYAVATCAAATPYAGLISNLNTRYPSNEIAYVKFVADVEGREYYLDNAALSANSDLVAVYEESGNWIKLGDELIWKSLVDTTKITVDCSAENGEFKDSVSLDMYYGNTKLDAEIALSGEGVEYVTLAGNTITRKANVQLLADKALTATISYKGIVKTVELTLLFDIDKVITYESGEFVIDKFTGKVLKANANNELVTYDATSYLAGDVTINGVAQTVVNTTEFAFDKAGLATLADGEKLVIISGENYLVAQVVTKVFFTTRDFFKDADGSGVVEDAEMVFANNFFNLAIASSKATVKIDGYYVLANNIDFNLNTALTANNGESSPNNTNEDFGFQGTFDGRGFAISNTRTYNVAGLFGLIKNATIKDIAFLNMSNDRNNGSRTYLARWAYDSTFENVYISATQTHWVGWNQGDTVTAPVINGISNSTFTNVVFENNAWKNTSINGRENSWTFFSASTGSATYANVNVIGAPSVITYTTHIKAADAEDGVAKHKVQLMLPLAEITKYVAAPGVYALADCGVYENNGVFKNLIDGIQKGEKAKGANIQFVEFIAETRNIGYYYDGATLASSTAADAYLATGNWIKLDGELIWKSVVDSKKLTISASDTALNDSITVDMLYNGVNLGAKLSVSDADAKYLSISGNTVSRANVNIFADRVVTITAEYAGLVKTIDITIPYDESKLVLYEAGEFVADMTTGKVYKANENNELVVYDATSFLGETVTINGVAQTVVNAETFTLDKAGLETLTAGSEYIIASGENALKAKAVTKVLATVNDFYHDLDGNGVIENIDTNGDGKIDGNEVDGVYDHREKTQANYIFNLKVTQATGAKLPSIAIKGYYVLANNIDLKRDTNLTASTGDQSVQIWNGSADVGFRATLDGRGFALKNGDPSYSTGGMFGAFYRATIKNIAFDGFYSWRNDGVVGLLGIAYQSTFENVYIRLLGYTNSDNYLGEAGMYAISFASNHGGSTVRNLVCESTSAFVEGATSKQQRPHFISGTSASFTNVTTVGLPATFKYANSATDATKKAFTLNLPAEVIATLGAQAGVEYALADCPEAAATVYATLFANLTAKYGEAFAYVAFAEDATGIANYIDNAAFFADAAAVEAYVATGYWKVNDAGSLVWAK